MGVGLALVVQPTYACDAACDYCSIHKLGSVVKPMSEETFDVLARRTDEFMRTKGPGSSVKFYWLGGEALLMPDRFYEYVDSSLSDSSLGKNVFIQHELQTNMIRFAKKELPGIKNLIKRNKDPDSPWDYELSTSFDPVSSVRKMKSGESYDALLARLVEELHPGDRVVVMSNGSFGGLHHRLLEMLSERAEA